MENNREEKERYLIEELKVELKHKNKTSYFYDVLFLLYEDDLQELKKIKNIRGFKILFFNYLKLDLKETYNLNILDDSLSIVSVFTRIEKRM